MRAIAPCPTGVFSQNPRHTGRRLYGGGTAPGHRREPAGRRGGTGHPVAIIERATLPEQRILRGTLANITALAAEQQVEPPALLIVGDVAGFARGYGRRHSPASSGRAALT